MALNLHRFEDEFAAAPLASPYSWPLTLAVLCDVFRLAGRAPPAPANFAEGADTPKPEVADKLGMVAHLLASTSLRDESVRGLRAHEMKPGPAISAFMNAIAPLTAEMIRANAFRREELVRRWLEAVRAEVEGETTEQSAARLTQLDYRTTLAEYQRAETSRQAEAERRAKLLKEAQDRETAARGWRE